jgi:EAL domain-containing protein (putative c-di-GMP-specific phosphodiesterase class I)
MSLYKQLWLAISLLMLIAFGVSFIVSSLSAKTYLAEQLYIKNSDNANALALSLASAGNDPVMLEITLASQFDTGFYRYIRLTAPDGSITTERQDESAITEAPIWFTKLFPISVEPGIAQVQSGWIKLGTLTLASHSRFAYRSLWESTLRLLMYFMGAAVVAGLLGNYLLNLITRPLGAMVEQAQAIGERRFVTTPEPSTLEFKAVVSSMNTLSSRIKDMLEQEAARLDQWRKDAQLDSTTKLLNRGPFIGNLAAALEREDGASSGVMLMIRIPGLIELNRTEGRASIDTLLKRFGETLNEYVKNNTQWVAGRLNGSDFALLATGADHAEKLGREVQKALLSIRQELSLDTMNNLPVSASAFTSGEGMPALLTRLDTTLLSAEQAGDSALLVASTGEPESNAPKVDQTGHWRELLQKAFANDEFELAYFPVSDMQGQLLHEECPARMLLDGELIPAGQFLPWINRLNMATELDKQAIKLALAKLPKHSNTLCINISAAALEDDDFVHWLRDALKAQPAEAARLWLEIPEYSVYQHLPAFRRMCQLLKPLNCRIGIEHIGHEIAKIGELHDLGIDYVKIDASLVRDIHNNTANQTLLRALCMIVHSIGLIAISEMVQDADEWKVLEGLGMDGATGPEVGRQLQG